MIRKRSSQNSQPDGVRWRRRVTLGIAFMAVLAVALFGRATATWGTRLAATRHLEVGAVGAAEQWLAWAAWLNPDDYRTDLMRAAGYRHLGQQEQWQSAVESAKQKGGQHESVQQEVELGTLRWGERDRIAFHDLDALLQSGTLPREAVTSVVHGLIAKGELGPAMELIEAWAADAADEAQVAYLRGMWFWSAGQRNSAEAEFENALASQPRHEMARVNLARLLEQQDRLSQALGHYVHLATAAPGRQAAQVDLARVLRKLGRIEDANAVLERPAPHEMSQSVAIELAEIEFESGNYEEAVRWFERGDIEGPHAADTLRAAATAFALQGDFGDAEQLFSRIDEAQSLNRQLGELQRRLAIDPNDVVAAEEYRHLIEFSATSGDDDSLQQASPLYMQHCAACHGRDGDGRGRAARHLYPRPSDFRGKFRLVSTLNGTPTLEDIERVIRRGIPGTAMPSFAELDEDQRRYLAQEVQQFRRQGIRKQLLALYEGEEFEQDEIGRIVEMLVSPGERLEVPTIGPAGAQSIARGRDLFFKLSCHHCHGEDGKGATDLPLLDDRGRPAVARDLVRDPMKGGSDAESLYTRIRLGMPGTPHPSAASLDEEELIALVHYCLSLSEEPKQELTNHQRAMRAFRRTPPVDPRREPGPDNRAAK